MSSLLVVKPQTGMAGFQRLEPYDTGQECVCSDCNGSFMSWYRVGGKPGREVKQAMDEKVCPECGCRIVGKNFTPCPRYEDPRTGIRFHLASSSASAGWDRVDSVAADRLKQWFPDEYAQSDRMRPVLAEIVLFVRLHELFPLAKLDRLIQIRKGMRSFICLRCGEPVNWQVQTDWERQQFVQETYLLSMDEAF